MIDRVFIVLFGSLALLAGIATRASAAPSEPDMLSVTAERIHRRWGGQTIQFVIDNNKEKDKRKATLFVSSNFIGNPQEYVRLGHYETFDLRRMELDRRTLINWQVGLAEETSEFADIDRQQPGLVRAYIGGFRLDPFAPQRSDALAFLERVWDLATWKPVEAVHITKKPGKDEIVLRYKGKISLREKKSAKELGCKNETSADQKVKALVCSIPKFGTAYLIP